MANKVKINEDLVRERHKCTFDVKELTHLIDGGKEYTEERKRYENIVFSIKELKDDIPEVYLSHKERYENAIRKACILTNVLREYEKKHKILNPTTMVRVSYAMMPDVTPFLLHNGMFVPTIIGQGTPEQQAEWLPKATAMEIIGTYAQTELGHGTFLRGLETMATYDPTTEEFVLNSPQLTSYKWWPGGLGSTVNHCIVVAQLYIKGKRYGIQAFIVQIRDMETHMPLPGIKVGEIGPKLGFQTANNGFLGFENFRIPRKNMLMKNAQVLKDGTFVKGVSEKLTYGTMVMVRVNIVSSCAFYTAMATTIAVRYSAVRHQSLLKSNEPEVQIMDFLTQQHKLFIAIASSHALQNVFVWLKGAYLKFVDELAKENMDNLPELHATSCCLKATATKDSAAFIEQCRLACGGHGFMMSSNLPILYGLATAAVTYEGEYTVLLLQTARYLIKAWQAALKGKVIAPSVSYLVDLQKPVNQAWQNTPEGVVRGFQQVAAGKIRDAFDTIEKHVKAGKDYEDAWNLSSVQLIKASEAHARELLVKGYWSETIRTAPNVSSNLATVLNQLAQLYLVYWALETSGDLLLYSNVSKADIGFLKERYEGLLILIRPNAVGLVDAFDISDEVLGSALGAYDGRVYERLMEEALKSPLNMEPVNPSFHKYIKPFAEKAKL